MNYGFTDARDIFSQPWFIGKSETIENYIEYCNERNHMQGWDMDTEIEMLSEVR